MTSFVEVSERGPGGDSGSLKCRVEITASSWRRLRPANGLYEGNATPTENKAVSSAIYFIYGVVVVVVTIAEAQFDGNLAPYPN